VYPHVTQFETRDRLILDEIRVRAERQLAHAAAERRRTVKPLGRLGRILVFARTSSSESVRRGRASHARAL
jgi:hypothetical protein